MSSQGHGADSPAEDLFSDVSLSKWSHLSGVIPSESKLVDVSDDAGARPPIMSLLIYEAFSRAADVIDIETLEFGTHIGTGASMNVYKGLHQGKAVALKVPRIGLDDRSKQAMVSVSLELRVHLSEHIRQHHNIVKLRGISWINEELEPQGLFLRPILVMELACEDYPTLDLLIGHLDSHDFGTKGNLISDIVGGLDAIHRESFVVGDLKPENILIFPGVSPNRQYVAKLSDFGYSDDIEVSKPGPEWILAGTEYWSAPECFFSLDSDNMVDVRHETRDLYSLGLVIWFILGSELPFGPDSGADWLARRENLRRDKLNDEIREMANFFVTNNLSAFNPIFNISNDILNIMSVGDKITVPKDVLDEKEAMQWYSHGLMSFTRGFDVEEYVHEELFRVMREKGLEWPLPKIHSASAALGQQINFKESLDSKFRCVMLDELLFREKLRWKMKDKFCTGYLPYAVMLFPKLLSANPEDRSTGRQWLQQLHISPERKASKIESWRPEVSATLRKEWSVATGRNANKDYHIRNLTSLPDKMTNSLRRQIQSDVEAFSTHFPPNLVAVLMDPFSTSSDDSQLGLETIGNLQMKAKQDYHSLSIRALSLGFVITGEIDPGTNLDLETQAQWCIENLCLYLYEAEKASGIHPMNDSLHRNVSDTLTTLGKDAQIRVPRLWYDVYDKPERNHAIRQSTWFLRPHKKDSPVRDKKWNEIVTAIRRDDVETFQQLYKEDKIPSVIDLKTEPGRSYFLVMVIELHLINILRFCVTERLIDLEMQMNKALTPLQWACQIGMWASTTSLLDLGADANALFTEDFVREVITYGSRKAIHILLAVKNLSVALPLNRRFDAAAQFKFDEKRFDTGLGPKTASAILIAIAENCWTTFAALLGLGVDIHKPCFESLNPLQSAVDFLRPLFVAALIDAGADPNIREPQELETPLHALARIDPSRPGCKWIYGDSKELRKPELREEDPNTHVQLALEFLLKAPTVDVNAVNCKGQTPLIVAAEQGKLDICKRLIAAGADPFARMMDAQTAVHVAINAGNVPVVEYFWGGWSSLINVPGYLGESPLFSAVSRGSREVLAALLNFHPSITATNVFGSTPLHAAIFLDRFRHFQTLVQQYEKTDPEALAKAVNHRDAFGRSCFHLLAEAAAARYQRAKPWRSRLRFLNDYIFPLLRRGNQADCHGLTPVHFACLAAPQVLASFLDAGFTATARDLHGITPLHIAYATDQKRNVQLLLNAGSTFRVRSYRGMSPSWFKQNFNTVQPLMFVEWMNDTLTAVVGQYDHILLETMIKRQQDFATSMYARYAFPQDVPKFKGKVPLRVRSRIGYLWVSENRWRGCAGCLKGKIAPRWAECDLFQCVCARRGTLPGPPAKSEVRFAWPRFSPRRAQLKRYRILKINICRILAEAKSLPDCFEGDGLNSHPPSHSGESTDPLLRLDGYVLQRRMKDSRVFSIKDGLASLVRNDTYYEEWEASQPAPDVSQASAGQPSKWNWQN